jgi:hypothetical protein
MYQHHQGFSSRAPPLVELFVFFSSRAPPLEKKNKKQALDNADT